jgi:cyclic pyranopterin phosphate synthase
MVDISTKSATSRTARAQAIVFLPNPIPYFLQNKGVKKGSLDSVISVCQVAGIMAAKNCSQLIPLCHTLPLSKVDVKVTLTAVDGEGDSDVSFKNTQDGLLVINTFTQTVAQTGVEMEALTAASAAALTAYDMCKGIDKSIEIKSVRLMSKSGGKTGDYEVI